MDNELKVRIVGDATDLKRSFQEAEKNLSQFEKKAKELEDAMLENTRISKDYKKAMQELGEAHSRSYISTTQYNKALDKLKKDYKETQVETENLRKQLIKLNTEQNSSGTPKLTKEMSANTIPTLKELGRIVQEAPYGVQNLGEGVSRLSTHFSYLHKQAGGTLPAIKALIGGMVGPAGLVFAVSAVVSMFSSLSANGMKLGDVLGYLSGQTDDLARAQKALNEASSSEIANAQGEMAVLNSLLSIAQDETRSKEDRQRAIDKINEQYGEYLPNLTLENIKTQEVKNAVDALTNSLVRQAKIRGAQNLIAKETEKILELQNSSAVDAATGWDIFTTAMLSAGGAANTSSTLVQKGLDTQSKGISESEKKIVEFKKRLNELLGEDIDAGGVFTSVKGDGGKSAKVTEDLAKKNAAIIKRINAQLFQDLQDEEIEKARETSGEVFQIYEESGARIKDALGNTVFDLGDADVDAGFKKIQEQEQYVKDYETVLKSLQKTLGEGFDGNGMTLDQLKKFGETLEENERITKQFAEAVGSTFSSLVQNIAGNIETGSKEVDAFISAIIQGLGRLITTMIENSAKSLAIKSADTTKSLALDTAKATGSAIAGGAESGSATGPGAIAAIPLMIAALVAVVLGAFGSIAKFAHGGVAGKVPGGSFVGDKIPALLNSGEWVFNQSQQDDLMALFDSNNRRAKVSSESGLEATTILRGSDILLSVKRSGRNNDRFSI